MVDKSVIKKQVSFLKQEHRKLDYKLYELQDQTSMSSIQMQRLKKEKLRLKDQIIKLQSLLLPDIIA